MEQDPRAPILGEIAANASTLWERLRAVLETGSARKHALACSRHGDEERATHRLDRWRERAAGNDLDLFATRLSWLGISLSQARRLCDEILVSGDLPDWVATLQSALGRAGEPIDQRSRTQPFGPVLFPFVRVALAALPGSSSVLCPGALESLAESLLEHLTHIAEPALYLEFAVFRSERQRDSPTAPGGSALYDEFTRRLLEGGLWDFFREYSVLARLLSTSVMFWSRNTAELVQAVEKDLNEIERVFNHGQPAGRVCSIASSESDSHNGGRSVSVLTFESGLRVVHKPRDLGIEKTWFELLDFLNSRGGEFRTLKVLTRGSYGWAEFAQAAPCSGKEDVRHFYARSGMLLCVLYALEASDCFYENVIACGGYPVLVDMETLMHHVLRRAGGLAPAEEIADGMIFDSVLRAGFLPAWEAGPDGVCVDISGLNARPGQTTPYLRRRWDNMNTDAMVLRHFRIVVDSDQHLPHLNGRAMDAADYPGEIAGGFRKMYQLLMRLRPELLASAGPVANLGKQEIRVVIHATRIYSLLMKRLAAPRHLRGGIDRSIETDIFSRFYTDSAQKSRYAAVLAEEIAAMELLDIPRFAVRADSRQLELPSGKRIEDAFEETALDRVRARLESMNAADLSFQVELIKACLRLSAVSVQHQTAPGPQALDAARAPMLSADDLVSEAAEIGAELERRMIRSADGDATWIAPQLLPRASHHQVRPLRLDLYNGLAGVGLFFAALDRVTGQGGEIAMSALDPLRRFLAVADPATMSRQGYTIGAATGLGSFIYGLVASARLLDEPGLLDSAEAAADGLTPEWIAADKSFDVMSGAAGLILGLLALHKQRPSQWILDSAISCGDHLLSARRQMNRGWAWSTVGKHRLTGLSHGAAGIALALLRLYGASAESRFFDGASHAMEFEDAAFDEVESNWPDFRGGEENPAFMNAWCHGAAGIGMARLSGRIHSDSPQIRNDIRRALSAVVSHPIGRKDGLCCGNLGRTELLVAAARAGVEWELEEEPAACARARASSVVQRARDSLGYRLSGSPGQDFFDPSLFQGLSGIGYEFLRIAVPERVPSVLAWE